MKATENDGMTGDGSMHAMPKRGSPAKAPSSAKRCETCGNDYEKAFTIEIVTVRSRRRDAPPPCRHRTRAHGERRRTG